MLFQFYHFRKMLDLGEIFSIFINEDNDFITFFLHKLLK